MAAFSLLETMRLDHGAVPRLERHLARMRSAAADFGYPWRETEVRAAVDAVARSHPAGAWRVRLLVANDGTPSIEGVPLEPLVQHRPLRVAFAADAIDDDDPFILHKTTERTVYDAARQGMSDVDDVLLWNRRGEVTESTIGNVVVEINHARYTPPVSCGLLAGTFRAEQLAAGAVHERVLTKADVATAERLWIINSVREWVEAELVGSW